MTRRRIWLLPAALGAAQLALWPGLAVAHGDRVEPAGVVLVLLIAAALGGRRRFPVAVTAVVAAGIGLGAWLLPGRQFGTPGDALLVISGADLVALFSVAVLRSRRTTVAVLAGLVLWQVGPPSHPVAADGVGDQLADLLLTACLYALVAAAGRLRRRWLADRSAATRRLATAERARLAAATAERSRLARELHDVTAHHLTSIVVNASAAEFLGDRRPELRAEALDFAARTGRDTLAALRRLVAVLPFGEPAPPAPAASLADLADDFRRLGQVVTLETTGAAPGEAILGIAREALTNTLRHAPGGTVRLHFRYGPQGADLIVDDDGPATGSGPDDHRGELGGGRGLTGMRERAESAGGTLRAGPRPGHGWRVHAVLPPAPSSPGPGQHPGTNTHPPAATPRRHRWWGSRGVLDAGLTGLVLVLPFVGVAVAVQDDDLATRAAALILLAASAHAAPLLWRRRHPWTVLAVVALTTWLGPLLAVTTGDGRPFLLTAGADLAAVYAVAAHGARPAVTWLAPFAAMTSTAYAAGVLAVIDPPAGTGPAPAGVGAAVYLTAIIAMLTGVVLVLPFGGSWLAGHTARRRRERRSDRERIAVATAVAQTEMRARAERSRVAAGLSEAVLEHTADVPRAAAEADLPGVLAAARAALAEMRALLDGLDDRPPDTTTPSARAPHTTAPHTATPRTTAPSTTAPSTTAPDTTTPSTTAPDTTTPDTTRPGATVPGSETGLIVTGMAGADREVPSSRFG
jgi:signal transduction histidine kinase